MAREMKDSGIEWIGKIPAVWNMNTIFQLFTQVKNKNSELIEKNLLSLSYGKIKRKSIDATEGLLPENFDGYNIIEADDIVLRLTDLQNDQRSLRVGLAHERGIVTSAYLTIRNRGNNYASYLHFFLHSFDIAKGFYGMGAGVRQGLNWDGLKWVKVTIPPVNEQHRLADFLDHECAEIDAVLEKTRASVEEYKKLKQAVITQAVTKGIRSDRPMKDSGKKDIGEIPADWSVVRLKYLLDLIIDCPHETPNYCSDGNYYVIRTADQDLGFLRSDENMYRLDANEYQNRIRRQSLDKDDIVYGREGERWGLACLVPASNKYCLGQRMMQFRCNCAKFHPEYAVYVLNSSTTYIQGALDTIGSTSPHVNISTMRNFDLPIPSIEEQAEIAGWLKLKCTELDKLISKKGKFLSELETYKKSLIYEYVTGKKEVV